MDAWDNSPVIIRRGFFWMLYVWKSNQCKSKISKNTFSGPFFGDIYCWVHMQLWKYHISWSVSLQKNQLLTIIALQSGEGFNDHVISVLIYKVVHYLLQAQTDSTSLLCNWCCLYVLNHGCMSIFSTPFSSPCLYWDSQLINYKLKVPCCLNK